MKRATRPRARRRAKTGAGARRAVRVAKQRPSGREDVMRAVLETATTQFALLGTRGASLREIAAETLINHALIHRYFASKDDLVRAVVDRAALQLAAILRAAPRIRGEEQRLFASSIAFEREWRVLAAALIEGAEPRLLRRNGFPGLKVLARRLEKESARGHDIDPRVLAAAMQAFVAGWVVFEAHALAGSGLTPSDTSEAREQAGQLFEAMVERGLRSNRRNKIRRVRAS